MIELTFTWKTVRIAAGNVSKLVVGVSSSKLNLQGENNIIQAPYMPITFESSECLDCVTL